LEFHCIFWFVGKCDRALFGSESLFGCAFVAVVGLEVGIN
jgi:hypothetical protein